VTKVSELADYILVVSGTTPPHLKAIAGEIEHALKQEGVICPHKAGNPDSGWIVLDYLNVVIHIFHPRMRQYYSIEDLWGQAPQVQ
jgi:ribosome-associated protein